MVEREGGDTMYLITMNEWIGPGRKFNHEETMYIPISEKTVLFATNMFIEDAFDSIMRYQKYYNQKHRLAINFTLLGISEMESVNFDLLEEFKVTIVEYLQTEDEEENDDE